MPEGHYQIGDLTFSYEGDLKEIAHCQEIVREVRQAEGRLKKESGAEKVYLIYDTDLEGERGTFDKLRLRAYQGDLSYTLDIGVTDNNPLGIYVASDQPIDVYNYETGENWKVAPDGRTVEKSGNRGPSGQAERKGQKSEQTPSGKTSREPNGTRRSKSAKQKKRKAGSDGANSSGAQTQTEQAPTQAQSDDQPNANANSVSGGDGRAEGATAEEIERAKVQLLSKLEDKPADQEIRHVMLQRSGSVLKDKIEGFAEYVGRPEGYLTRVVDVLGETSLGEVRVKQVPRVVKLIREPESLVEAEELDDGDELPF